MLTMKYVRKKRGLEMGTEEWGQEMEVGARRLIAGRGQSGAEVKPVGNQIKGKLKKID